MFFERVVRAGGRSGGGAAEGGRGEPASLFGALIGKRRGREDIRGEKKGIAQ